GYSLRHRLPVARNLSLHLAAYLSGDRGVDFLAQPGHRVDYAPGHSLRHRLPVARNLSLNLAAYLPGDRGVDFLA
ncbi:hypothetical protein, partial [Raoultella ornithinolytica]|uniref:hypothetical protein n=1 Tax=Raoultella ornithinolytica TaxID=54291 RepID=UPI003D6E2B96